MTKIIADACANHMGDKRIMEAMIKSASSVGVDFIKFQSFRADKLRKDWPNYDSEYAYYKHHELSKDDHIWLMEKCKGYGIGFLTTVFDLDTADMLAEIGVRKVKIASPDANNWELIDKCLGLFDTVIISTGMHTDEEVRMLKVKYAYFFDKNLHLLHCVSSYPTPVSDLNMAYVTAMSGFSDHTIGTDASKLAIAMGADYVERHFTLSRDLPTRDRIVSSTPDEFMEIC